MTNILETQAKSILRVRRRLDSWFISRCGLNLYRGCAHACAYCDGRSENYRAPEDFANTIEVKVNALAVLERELKRLIAKNAPEPQLNLFEESSERRGQPPPSVWNAVFAHIKSKDVHKGCARPSLASESSRTQDASSTLCRSAHSYADASASGEMQAPMSASRAYCHPWPREMQPSVSAISGFLTLGGGVSDQYQPLEGKYKLARGVLELCLRYTIPIHILTKSTLVLRDIDLLRAINERTKVLLSVSISTLDPAIAAIVEPGAPPPEERLAMFEEFRAARIACGVFLLPVLPFLSDTPAAIHESVSGCARAGARYVLFGGLTLKAGRQTEHYLDCLTAHFPALAEKTRTLFRAANQYGIPDNPEARERWLAAQKAAAEALQRHGLSTRIPPEIFASIVSAEDRERILRM